MGLLDFIFGPPNYPTTITVLQEQAGGILGSSADPDLNLTAEQGGSRYFRSLTQGKRDLPEITQERAQEIAYYLYETNPAAGNILETTRDFVLGEGVSISVEDEDEERKNTLQGIEERKNTLQGILDSFWNDAVNQMDLKLYSKVLELGLYGEQCYPVFVNPVDGHVRLGYIDPGAIKQVICDPENVEIVQAIALKDVGGALGRLYRVIHVDESDPAAPAFGRLVGALEGETFQEYTLGGQPLGEPRQYAGSCFYFAINKVSNAKRGRSDLLRVADWIDAYDQYLFNELDRALLMKIFIFDTTLEGMSATEIAEYIKTQPKAKPGTEFYHNEKVKREAITPDLKAQDAQTGADLFMSYIATGVRRPKTWLNGLMDVNRATAQEMAEPAFKALTARQRYVRYMLEHIINFVLDQAELRGASGLTRREGVHPVPWSFTVNMPEMRSKDLNQAATSLNQAAQALATAKADGAIDTQVEQDVLVALLSQFGVDVDLEAMRVRLEAKEQEQDEERARAPYPTQFIGDGV